MTRVKITRRVEPPERLRVELLEKLRVEPPDRQKVEPPVRDAGWSFQVCPSNAEGTNSPPRWINSSEVSDLVKLAIPDH